MATIECVHVSEKQNNRAHLVFVHGLGGDPHITWMSDPTDRDTFWPKWVGRDSDCNVWTLGYDATLAGWTGNAMSVPQQGTAVLDALNSERALRGRNLILVGHSLGGVVIKQAVANALTLGVERYQKLVDQIIGVAFIATPHTGSDLANLARILKPMLQTNEQVGNLTTHNTHLLNLNAQFRATQSKLGFCVRSFSETRGVFVGQKFLGINIGKHITVVKSGNSDPSVIGEVAIPLSEDHLSICKPRDTAAPIHKSLLDYIEACERTKAASQSELNKSEQTITHEKTHVISETSKPKTTRVQQKSLAVLRSEFFGGDPIKGMNATMALVATGRKGDEIIFNQPLAVNMTTQIYRRWIKYIKLRQETVGELLLEKLAIPSEQYTAGMLMAGLPMESEIRDRIYSTYIKRYFECSGDRYRIRSLSSSTNGWDGHRAALLAYGCIGGSPALLWDCASGDRTAWEKTKFAAFRGACYSFGRGNLDYETSLSNFLRYEYPRNSRSTVEIDPAATSWNSNECISSADLSAEANWGAFSRCMRNDMVDLLISNWANHNHWRVRYFASMILAKVDLTRLKSLFLEWLHRETHRETKGNIQRALFNIECRHSTPDFLINALKDSDGIAEDLATVVMLAKNGYRHRRIERLTGSANWFERANGLLAAAYLQDKRLIGTMADLMNGTSNDLERTLACAAGAIAGLDDCANQLHEIASNAAATSGGEFKEHFDARLMHPYLQTALIDGLKKGLIKEQVHAWEQEMAPVNP